MILWMLEDSDNGKGDLLPRERGRIPRAQRKEQEKMVQSHQDKRTRKRSKVSVGIAGKHVVTSLFSWLKPSAHASFGSGRVLLVVSLLGSD